MASPYIERPDSDDEGKSGDREALKGELRNQDAQDLEIQVVDKTKDVLKLRLLHTESSFANALRRIMLCEVPILAIDTVEVFKNDSVLHDEMLVHRMGLLPLETVVGDTVRRNVCNELIYPRDCSCDNYCPRCSVTFDLHVRCVSATRRTVTSHDLRNAMTSPDDIGYNVRPVHSPNSQDTYPIVLVELARGQEIKVRCVARKGIGKEHSKWNAACTVAMQYVPEINLNEKAFAELAASDKARWIRYCPRKVYSYDKARNKVEVNPENVNSCFFCDECTSIGTEPYDSFKGKKQLVSVRRKRDQCGRFEFLFKIETTGCMTSVELLKEAITILYSKIKDATDSLHNNLEAAGREGEIIARHGDSARSSSRPGLSPSGSPTMGGSSPFTSSPQSGLSGATSAAATSGEDIPWI